MLRSVGCADANVADSRTCFHCRCPICSAPKRRFKPYAGASGRNDAKSMNKRYQEMQRGGGAAAASEGTNAGLLVGLAAGAVVLAGLYVALSTYYS